MAGSALRLSCVAHMASLHLPHPPPPSSSSFPFPQHLPAAAASSSSSFPTFPRHPAVAASFSFAAACSLPVSAHSLRAHAFPSRRLQCVCENSGNSIDVKEQPPASREEAVQQARSAISYLQHKTVKKRQVSVKSKKLGQRQTRLRVEIPLLDASPHAIVSLTKDLLVTLTSDGEEQYAVFYTNSALTELATTQNADKSLQYFSLGKEESVPLQTSAIFAFCPTFSQISDLSKIAKAASSTPVVVVNPNWSADEEEDEIWRTFCKSFEVIYSYTPLCIQGFLSRTEGAILKHVKHGSPAATSWLIFVKEDDIYVCVSSRKSRPSADDLQSVLYNSMAGNSALVKSIKFLRKKFGSN